MQKNIPCKCLIIPAIALLVVIIYDEYMQANNAKGIKVVGASNQHLPSVVQPVPQDRRRITKRRTNPPSHSKIAQSQNRKTTKSKRTRQTKKNVPKTERENKQRRYTRVPKMVRAWKKYRMAETKYPGFGSCMKINCRRHAQCKGKGRAQKCNTCNLYMRKCTPSRGRQNKGAKCTDDRECYNSVCDIRPGPIRRGGALDKVCQLWNGRKVDYKSDWNAARVKELYKIHGKWPNDPRTYITEKYEDRHLNKIAKDKHGMVFVFRESDVKVLHHQIKKHGPRQAFGGRIDEESIAEQMPVYKNGIAVISGSDAIKLRKWATKPADAVEELGLSPWIGSHSSSELRFVRIPPGHVMRSNLRLLNGNENGINRGMFEPGGRAPGGAHFRMAKLDWYPYGLIALLPEYRWGEHFSSEKLKQD